MTLSVAIYDRRFGGALSLGNVHLAPVRYAFRNMGGPESAEFVASGDLNDLAALLNLLRCPIEILDFQSPRAWQGRVWWGYIHEVEIDTGVYRIGYTLENMANAVAVRYSRPDAGTGASGLSVRTAFATDADSVAEYGRKELILQLSKADDVAAVSARDLALPIFRLPQPLVFQFSNSRQARAILRARGWWETLSWRYMDYPSGRVAAEPIGTMLRMVHGFGHEGGRMGIAVRWSSSSPRAWDLNSIAAMVGKFGSPGDYLIVSIHADGGTVPGTVLYQSSPIWGPDLSAETSWQILLSVDPPIRINPGVFYWLSIRRTGGTDGNNFYSWGAEFLPGRSGWRTARLEGGTWISWFGLESGTPPFPIFRVAGKLETHELIRNILLDFSQFFRGIEVVSGTGRFVEPFYDDTLRAIDAIEELLRMGTAQDKRLRGWVTPDLRLRIETEPDIPARADQVEIRIRPDGLLEGPHGEILDVHVPPVGIWVGLKDWPPPTVNTSSLSRYDVFFIDRAEFDVESWRLSVEPRGAPSPWDISRIVEG